MITEIKSLRHTQGINIVELMVALALGSFLSIGVIQMYASHRLTTNNVEGVAQMQDNTRFALRMITKAARGAGYTGCVSKDRGLGTDWEADDIPITNLLNNSTGLQWDFGEAIFGYDDLTGTIPVDLGNALTGDPTPEAGTDVLILRGTGDNSVPIASNNNGAQFFAVETTNEPGACPDGTDRLSGLCEQDVVLASDCQKSVIFQITGVTSGAGGTQVNVRHAKTSSITPGNSVASWGGNSSQDMIGEDGEILKMVTNIFYIGDNNGRPALYRKVNAAPAELIAANVVDFQVLYGEGASGTVTQYSEADAVTNWGNVMSVRVNLLMASDNDNIVGDYNQEARMSVPFNGDTFTASDRRLYRAVTATTVLRNRTD